MAVWAIKKKTETNERLIKRWKRQTQNARIMQKVREDKFHKGTKTKIRIREEAISREGYRAKREKERFYM